MKVEIEFKIESLDELDKITKKIGEVVPQYKVKMEIDSSDLNAE